MDGRSDKMALSDTMNQLNHLITALAKDLSKVHRGNKTAAQRVRTGTIKLEKVGKVFRKESIQAERSGRLKKKVVSKTKSKPKKKK